MSSNIMYSISEDLIKYTGELRSVNFYLPENLEISITKFQNLYQEKAHSSIKKEVVFSQALQDYIIKATNLIETANGEYNFEELFTEEACMLDESNISPKGKKTVLP